VFEQGKGVFFVEDPLLGWCVLEGIIMRLERERADFLPGGAAVRHGAENDCMKM
jgi:hypothetical protein